MRWRGRHRSPCRQAPIREQAISSASRIVVLAALAAAVVSWSLIALTRPWLARIASAKPNARSSHATPTPQGAGLGMVAAIVGVSAALILLPGPPERGILHLFASLIGLAALGFADDISPLPWTAKLAAQGACVLVALAGLPASASILPWPDLIWPNLIWAERAVTALALLAFLNIVNFVDGIDEITAAHALPALALIALASLISAVPPGSGILAASGFGAVAGFWLWNRHPARIFLGDSGSLPLGLLIGWLALSLALNGRWTAAILIVLYPALDGAITLVRRLVAGQRLTQPHRDHAYQRAVDTGLSAPRVAATVALVSAATAVLALVALAAPHPAVAVGALATGLAWTLFPIMSWLRRGRP